MLILNQLKQKRPALTKQIYWQHRLISAAPFRDRVVYHALSNLIEPIFERGFIFDSSPAAWAKARTAP